MDGKRFVKKYIDEFNPEIDMIEEDILIISDELTGEKHYMDFLDDKDKEKTTDDLINKMNKLNEENTSNINFRNVTVNDLYLELKKLIENGDGDKPVKLCVKWNGLDNITKLEVKV